MPLCVIGIMEEVIEISNYATKLELIRKFNETSNPTELEKAIFNLKCMELDIMPYSRAWRWGYKKALKMAIKALEAQLSSKEVK